MLKRRTRANLKLEAGLVFLLCLVAVGVFGPTLAPYGLDETWTAYYVDMPDGTRAMKTAPEPPSREHWFGTNKWGYDLLTLMLHGARYTIFIGVVVAGLRVTIGALAGTALGLRSGQTDNSQKGPLLPGLPVLIVLIFVLHPISVNSNLTVLQLFLIHSVFLTIPGVPGVSSAVRSRITAIRRSPMIDSGIVAGAALPRLLHRYYLPAIMPDLGRYFFQECTRGLMLVGQLGMFNVFMGGTLFTPAPPLLHSMTHEWAGLVGQNRFNLQYHHWTVLFPLAGYLLVLLTLHLITRGLDAREQMRHA